MTEQYEYERVEIKSGDNKTWQDTSIYVGVDKLAYTILHVGEHCVFASRLSPSGNYSETIYDLEDGDFYIRKPKRKMVKKALAMLERYECGPGWVLKPSDRAETLEYFERVYTKDRIKKWPYGEIIEVEEGD